MKHPWDRRKSESNPAWAAFQAYRDLPNRSIARARELLGRPAGYDRAMEAWSSQHEWVARAAAFDAHIDGHVQARIAKERSEAAMRRLNLARGLQAVAGQGLQKMLDDKGKLKGGLKASEVATLAKVGNELERLEDGEPAAVFRHEGGVSLEVRVVDVQAIKQVAEPVDEDAES